MEARDLLTPHAAKRAMLRGWPETAVSASIVFVFVFGERINTNTMNCSPNTNTIEYGLLCVVLGVLGAHGPMNTAS
jgi:hypothetical protein